MPCIFHTKDCTVLYRNYYVAKYKNMSSFLFFFLLKHVSLKMVPTISFFLWGNEHIIKINGSSYVDRMYVVCEHTGKPTHLMIMIWCFKVSPSPFIMAQCHAQICQHHALFNHAIPFLSQHFFIQGVQDDTCHWLHNLFTIVTIICYFWFAKLRSDRQVQFAQSEFFFFDWLVMECHSDSAGLQIGSWLIWCKLIGSQNHSVQKMGGNVVDY